MTSFEQNIADEYDLVEQLRNGSFEAVKLDS
jgi:hypothetical protein